LTDWNVYPDSMSLLEARAKFFDRASLGPDGGYQDRWVRIAAKPISFYFPNTRSRVAAARLHDLHHIATGYRSDWPGEPEIAAWELASGCGPYRWAWILNLGAFLVGLLLFPRTLWRAFVRGRHARNLYHIGLAEEQLPLLTVGALRRALRLGPASPAATVSDTLAFVAWSLLAVVYHGAILVGGVVIALLAYRSIV
jgi:hypothetical protein